MFLTFNSIHLPIELNWFYCYNVNVLCVFTYLIVLWTCKKDCLEVEFDFFFPFWKQKRKSKKKRTEKGGQAGIQEEA